MPGLLGLNLEPLDALYSYFNVFRVGYHVGPIEERFVMNLTTVHGTQYPTHCLAVRQHGTPPNSPALMLPVCRDLYKKGFAPNLPWPKEDDPSEVPHEAEDVPADMPITIPPLSEGPVKISLPVYSISVPHLISLPLLLLYGLRLETDFPSLSYRLLPSAVIEEFPAPPAMAEIFARFPEEQFERYYVYLDGFWRNARSLGLKDEKIMDLVSTSWSVACEARRLRQRFNAQGVQPQQRRRGDF